MQLGGLPNDAIQVLSPAACVLLGPVIQKGLYPFLRRAGIRFGPIARIDTAFVVMGVGMAFASGVQKLIYSLGPCYEHPLACSSSEGGTIPNQISVWVQSPVYFIIAVAEIMGFATLSEYSYSEAPRSMRTLVQALSQLSAGVGSALGIALSPLAVDPKLVYFYAGLAVSTSLCALGFFVVFRNYDRKREEESRSND